MNDLLTIVFVSFYSEKKILDYLKYFNNNFKIIIIDNANDLNLKVKLQGFSILKIINNKENIGFGAALNQGLEMVNTKYAMHLDIDTKFEISSINKMITEAEKIKDFAMLGPKISNYTYKNNHFIKKKYENNYNLMKYMEGCCLFFNLNEIKKIGFFDENFFLYFEEVDLVTRCLKKSLKVIMIDDISIEHIGGSSVSEEFSSEVEINRNWHYMWSKFYYFKKHSGYFYALLQVSRHIISSFLKFIYYLIFKNDKKKIIYKARLSGCINSILLKKSWFRPKI
tara:strand:+ start:1020 stop:1865 length:846 start_codon:yes stop_codon:yes gene_type:complete